MIKDKSIKTIFSRFLNEFDFTLSILGIVVSIAVLAFILAVKPRLIYVLTSILLFVTCAVWLWIGRKTEYKLSSQQSVRSVKILAPIFFFLFALSIIVVYLRTNTYERPLGYFLITSVMAGVIALESLEARGKQALLVLLQIIVIGVSVCWSQLLIFPHSLAGIDPWWHQGVTNSLIETHLIPNTPYSGLPFFHLLVGSTSIILNLDYKIAAMVSASFVQILINSLVIYALGMYIFKDPRVGLLAALILIISQNQLSFSFWTVPTSLAAVFVLIAVLILIKTRYGHPAIGFCLLAFMIIATTLTNSVTSLFLIVALLAGFGASQVYKIKAKTRVSEVSIIIPFFSIVTVFSWWAYASGYLEKLGELFSWGLSRDYYARDYSTILLDYTSNVPLIDQLLNNFGLMALFSISIFGVLYMLSRKDNYAFLCMAIMGLAPLAVGFSSLLLGGAALEQRWWYYAQILLSVAMAIAFILFIGKSRFKNLRTVILVVAIIVICLISTLSPIADMDNRALSENLGVRYAMTDSEMQAMRTSSAIWNGDVFTDSYFKLAFASYSHPSKSFDDALYQKSFVNCSNGIILLRSEVVHDTFSIYGQPYRLDYDPRIVIGNEGFSKIYISQMTEGYAMT